MARILIAFLLGMPLLITAQTPITWHLTFDPVADRDMDSLQGCWQVGMPDKTVFDSALSAPNALVTDSVAPYPVGGISYAEFSLPMNFWAESGTLTFQHAMDVDSGEAHGWLEYFDAQDSQSWVKVDPWGGNWPLYMQWSGAGLQTDSALIFTGSSNGWVNTTLEWYCTLVVLMEPGQRMTYADSLRFRFAFQALANSNGRDGWMIDDLVVTNLGCPGSIHENAGASLRISPNPASERITIELTGDRTGPYSIEVFRADGALVLRDRITAARSVLHVASLPVGLYMLCVKGANGKLVERLLIQR